MPGQDMTTSTGNDALSSAATDTPTTLVSGLSASRRACTRSRRARPTPRARAASMCGASSAESRAPRVCRAIAGSQTAATAATGRKRLPSDTPERAAQASSTMASTTAGEDSKMVVTAPIVQSTADPRAAAAASPSAMPASHATTSAARFSRTVFHSRSATSWRIGR